MVVLAAGLAGGSPPTRAAADGNESPTNSFAARAVTAGRSHTCALTTDAAVRCWGRNDLGQLGLGDTANRGDGPGEMGGNLPTVDLGTGRSATAVTAGTSHTCALLDNATVKCWGANASGQLGLGDTANRGDGPGEMGNSLPAVNLGAGRSATAISAGDAHTCAVLDNAKIRCWGANASGQLGLGDTAARGDGAGEMGDSLPTVDLDDVSPFTFSAVSVSAGTEFTCALSVTNRTKCWGRNDSGQLGQGDTASRGDGPGEMGENLPRVELGTGRSARAITTGNKQACARLDNAAVKCWGNNSFGELGLGDSFNRGDGAGEMGDNLPAIALGTGRTAAAVTTGEFHTCALLDDGTAKCWGSNTFGELGQGETTIRGDDAGEMGDDLPAIALGTGRTATAVTAGATHSCARLDDRSLKCWGLNDHGRLGLGDTAHRGDGPGEMGDDLPRVATADRARTAVAPRAGDQHTCSLLDNGTVRCWGRNNAGQLGRGDTIDRGDQPDEMGDVSPPIDLGAGRTATGLATGGQHTCALLDDGAVKCFGANNFGQLGVGDQDPRGNDPGEMGDDLAAADLGTGRTATAVAAGTLHSCALLDNGTVKCWGLNSSGELGLGDNAARGDNPGEMGDNLPAVALGTGRTATAISVGANGRHACARLDNGAVKCWGNNGSGQLGLGDLATRGDGPGEMGDSLPTVNLGTGRTATALASGTRHTCATLDNHATKCWGENSNGQLGLGTTDDRGDAAGEMGNALPPLNLGAGRTATAVTTGTSHTCARLNNGAVKCWGLNTAGRLGLADTADRGDGAGEMGDNLPLVDVGSAPGSAIWGRVTNAVTGAPVGGAFVVVMHTDDFSIERGTVAASDGTFTAPVDPGSYFVYLIDGTGAHTAGFAGAPTIVTVVAHTVADTGAAMAPTRGSINGTITETGPSTPIGWGIAISLTGGGGVPEVASVADANGAYALPPLNTGPHFVGFVDPAGNHASRFHPNSPNVPDATPLNVTAGGSTAANGSLPTQAGTGTGAVITGTVENDIDQPLGATLVFAMHAADFRLARAGVTDAAGQYSLAVAPGSYKLVFLDIPGRHDMEWFDNEPFNGIAGAANVTAPGSANAHLDRRTGTLAGTITAQESGNPLGGAWVVAIGPSGPAGRAVTAPNGTYTIPNLPAGTYRAVFVDPAAQRATEFFDNAADFASATPFAMTAGGSVTVNAALALL